MRVPLSTPHVLFAFALLAISGANSTAWAARKIEMVIVSERFDSGTAHSSEHPESADKFVLFDAGFIEAGDSAAGERPPHAADVVTAASNALSQALSAPDVRAHDVAIIMTWGVIRPDSYNSTPLHRLNPNYLGRLSLVTTARMGGTLSNYMLKKEAAEWRNPNYPTPFRLVGGELWVAAERSLDSLYFLTLSAYDRAALEEKKARLVWRTSMSARDIEERMDRAILTFAKVGVRYYGRDSDEVRDSREPVADMGANVTPVVASTTQDSFVRALIHAEYQRSAGELMDLSTVALVEGVKEPDRRYAAQHQHK